MTVPNPKVGVIALLAALVLPLAGCPKAAPDAAPAAPAANGAGDANDKRWSKYQEGNKKDTTIANAAFERRQAQLAAKRKGAAK